MDSIRVVILLPHCSMETLNASIHTISVLEKCMKQKSDERNGFILLYLYHISLIVHGLLLKIKLPKIKYTHFC